MLKGFLRAAAKRGFEREKISVENREKKPGKKI
jgi:hypothetical protein